MTIPERVDVVVAGTGASGLVAALRAAVGGASVLAIDSGLRFGGTTALSGGRVWIPANGTPENAGDSREHALTYLRQIFDPRFPRHTDVFVDTIGEAARFVEGHSAHRFVVCPNYPDYHPHLAGATCGGRTFDAGLVARSDLVDEASRILVAPAYTPLTHAEWERWRYPEHIDHDLLRERREQGILTGGPGLVAALIDGAVRAGVRLAASTALVDVLVDHHGVTAAVIHTPEGEQTVSAGAVVLATGGFDADDELRAKLLPGALGVSASAPTDTGTALDIADRHDLATGNLGGGWWMPMLTVHGEELDGRPYPRGLVRERGVPHMIVVDGSGQRCVDEASPYNEFGKAIHAAELDVTWMVFDQRYRDTYPLPGLPRAGRLPPNIHSAATVAALARSIGVDPAGLERTVATWNRDCVAGVDTEFGRGSNAYDDYYGDPRLSGNRSMGPIERAPFYATRIYSGVIGSKGGPVTTVDGVVTRADGTELPGLYAVGNAAAFWTGDGYPGPGATLAVGIAYGFRAGRHAADGALRAGPHGHDRQ